MCVFVPTHVCQGSLTRNVINMQIAYSMFQSIAMESYSVAVFLLSSTAVRLIQSTQMPYSREISFLCIF